MEYDILIENGYVLDGTGNPWFRADVGIVGDTIEAIGRLRGSGANRRIDARGLIVAPGFIDIHSHSDFTILLDPGVESKIRQGVTTEVVGNCGTSAAPMNEEVRAYRERYMRGDLGEDFEFNWRTMGEYLDLIDEKGASFNVVALVGHGTVRQNVMGFEDRPPTEAELEEMKRLVAEAMEDGAWGMSTGLIYPPSCYAETDEIVELAKVVARYGGIYATHIRGEGRTLLEAVREAIEIGERAGIPVEISHFKASGRENWRKTKDSLKLVEEARRRGVDVTFDQYPYTASSTGLAAFLPHWVHEGGLDRLLERLKDPETRRKIKEEGATITRDWSSVMVVLAPKHPQYEGKRITEIAELEGKEPMDTVFDLLLAEEAQVRIVAFGMCEEDVRRVMRSPYMMVGSDGRAVAPRGVLGRGKPHPRYYGTFPRVLGHYVREGVLTLQEAMRKMTSLPAQRLGLRDRGLLREGFKADITIFDPDSVRDEATFTDPHRFPSGIPYVIVNGVLVIDGGEHTGALPGKALRKSR
ncbi:D-aminoacylase [Candidatus Bathyarchaeota archaeon]|nr:MAG: D-aminoacylase [Candidatus Bathyarchaeota archaeon]